MSAMTEEKLSKDDFKFAFRGHPAGVGIVTADIGDGPVALTVSSLFSVSLEPPTLVFSASSLSSATPTILKADTVVVHMVDADQVDLAKLGATSGVNRFSDDVEWGRLPTGEPYYPGAAVWLRGRVKQIVPAGGSNLVVVEALEAKPRADEDPAHISPLVYHNRAWHVIGDHSKIPD